MKYELIVMLVLTNEDSVLIFNAFLGQLSCNVCLYIGDLGKYTESIFFLHLIQGKILSFLDVSHVDVIEVLGFILSIMR